MFYLTTSYLTRDALTPEGKDAQLLHAQRWLFDFDIKYLLVGILAVTAVSHLLMATVLRRKYEEDLESESSTVRWYSIGLSTSIIMVVITLLVGVSDLSTMLLIAVSTMLSFVVGSLVDSNMKKSSTVKSFAYCRISFILRLIPWVVVAIYLFSTRQYGDGGLENYVYWITGSSLALVAMFGLVRYMRLKKKLVYLGSYANVEKTYLTILFVLNTAIVWQIYFALLK